MPAPGPRHSLNQMARMMDSLILDPFMGNPHPFGGTKSRPQGMLDHDSKPVGPVRPRINSNYCNQNYSAARRQSNNQNNCNNNHEATNGEYLPSNPNTAGARGWGDIRTEGKKNEDCWKASLRKRDTDIQPTLPNISGRSRYVLHS